MKINFSISLCVIKLLILLCLSKQSYSMDVSPVPVYDELLRIVEDDSLSGDAKCKAIGQLDINALWGESSDKIITRPNGMTVFHFAAWHGDIEVVNCLWNVHSASRYCSNYINAAIQANNLTPLMIAVLRGHLDVATRLVELGADVNTRRDAHGRTLLHLAAYSGKVDSINYFFDLCDGVGQNRIFDIDIRSNYEQTPLMAAVFGGHLDAARRLIELGADVMLKDINGNTLLHCAVGSGKIDVIHYILNIQDATGRRLFPIDTTNKYGTTPLMLAAAYGHLAVVLRLIELGADVNHINNNRHTALHRIFNSDNSDSPPPVQSIRPVALELVRAGARLDIERSDVGLNILALTRTYDVAHATEPDHNSLELQLHHARADYIHNRRNRIWLPVVLRLLYRNADDASIKRSWLPSDVGELIGSYVANHEWPAVIVDFNRLARKYYARMRAIRSLSLYSPLTTFLQRDVAYDAAHFGNPEHYPREARLHEERIEYLESLPERLANLWEQARPLFSYVPIA